MFLRGQPEYSLCYCQGFEFWPYFKLRGRCRTRPPRGGPAVRSPRGAVTSTCGVKKEENFPSSTCIEFRYSNLRLLLTVSIFFKLMDLKVVTKSFFSEPFEEWLRISNFLQQRWKPPWAEYWKKNQQLSRDSTGCSELKGGRQLPTAWN